MFQKKLSALSPESVKYQAAHVFLQWISLLATIGFTAIFTGILGKAQERSLSFRDTGTALAAVAAIIIIKFLSAIFQEYFSFKSSETVKATLRNRIFSKLRRLGASYKERISSAEVVQLTGEGVDQLETYFGAYIPQLFYSILAPLTLFVFFTPVDALCAAVLFVCVPLIPLTIALVQTFAKRLLSKYWGQYGDLGNTFLENLQGMTTLKIYRTDGLRNEAINQEAEKFRRITMKVLTMQLNSIFVMDFIAYGGAGTGIILALLRLQSGALDFSGCLMFILLSADFFIPMRRLGSFFHIAMNGIAAGEKILRLLGLPEPEEGTEPGTAFAGARISAEGLFFSYDGKRTVLKNVAFTVDGGSLTAIVGESGSGKSTIAALLAGRIRGYDGSITVRGCELSSIKETELLKNTVYTGAESYLFKGTVQDNLRAVRPGATEEELWEALEKVRIAAFFREAEGLQTKLTEGASNLSGGQRQRLALARALLFDGAVYIFDEASSNIDAESEKEIIDCIYRIERKKTVVLITHRLANAERAGNILVMNNGCVAESGTHRELYDAGGYYRRLWDAQQKLEQVNRGGGGA